MTQPNKRVGIGLAAEEEPTPPTKRLALEPNSAEFLEAQNHYAKIRAEIQATFIREQEAAFRKSMTAKMKAEIRHGMVLDVQEEQRKMLVKQKERLMGELRKEARKQLEKEMGLAPDREEKLRETIRRGVREEIRADWEVKIERVMRDARYEREEEVEAEGEDSGLGDEIEGEELSNA
ncbi:hypothetical protein NA56DRAFT_697498 [Hyaloscypha hepaticicola]|uniref:Uncharacterized protein n=1 Tax=Hyaloscypha hepaticicola TaxID=2082293 RepID=A0A2J6QM40_9HELO|nr:hypothetical protein NA56DRAFT_697498 [Hyaloscypha hepaticicola]